MKEFFNFAARPEIDTIRLYLKVDLKAVSLDAWFSHELLREICVLEAAKDENGEFVYENGWKKLERQWSKERLDFRNSTLSRLRSTVLESHRTRQVLPELPYLFRSKNCNTSVQNIQYRLPGSILYILSS